MLTKTCIKFIMSLTFVASFLSTGVRAAHIRGVAHQEDETTRHLQQSGGGGGGGNSIEMGIIQNLLDYRSEIQRNVTHTDNGVTTKTISNDGQVADWIQKHVLQMIELADSGGRIRQWDPFFEALFDHVDESIMDVEIIDDGIAVNQTGTSDCGISLAQWHADLVSKFVDNGRSEVQLKHDVPPTCT